MNSIQINCFLEAVKQKSFSKAASSLFISQPTFSRNIAGLEEELGLTLFHRNSFHGIELTEAGELMQTVFSAARKEILAALDKAQRLEQESQMQMQLGLLIGQLLDSHLEELIAEFRLEYPNVSVNIKRDTYKGLMKSLLSGDIDIVYMPKWQYQDPAELQICQVSNMETRMVVPKRLFPKAEDRVYSLAEFKEFPFINIADEESSTLRKMMPQLFQKVGISPQIHEAESLQKQIGMVEMGEGIILINPNNSVCYSPNVHCLTIKELEPQPFAIAWRKAEVSECVSLFSRFLQRSGNMNK